MAELVIKLVNGELAGKTAQEIAKQINLAGTAARKAKVGTQEWVDAHAKLDKAKALQEDLRKQVQATTGASNMLKNSWNQLPGAQHFNDVAGSFGLMKNAVGGLTSGFKILKFAIAATGLGLLVILLASAFAWFQKTERGADFLSKAMAMAGAAVNVLIDRASKLIDALIAFVSGDWDEAAKKFGEATADVTEEIQRETQAAWELADALDKLEELEGKLILIRSRTKQQVSELRLISKDETKTFAERAAALESAIALTRQLNAEELEAKKGRVLQALQVRDLTELQQQYGVTLEELLAKGEDVLTVDNLGLGESMQEDLNKAFEAIAAYNEEIALSNDKERTLVMDLNTLKKKARGEDTKDQAAALKAQQDALKEEYAALENIGKLEAERRLALMDDEQAKEIEKLNIDTEEKIVSLKGSEAQILEQIKLLRDIQGMEMEAIDKKWADKKDEERKKQEKKDLDDSLAAIQLQMATEQNTINEHRLANQITDQEFTALSAQNVLTHEQQKLAILKAAHGEESAEYQRAYANFLSLQQAAADASVQTTENLAKDQMAALQGGLQVFGNVFGAMAGMYEEGTQQWKSMATAQAIISTIQGAINAYTSTAAIPIIGGVLAPIAAGLALAAGMANVKKIQNTKVQSAVKKERGGLLSGPRHSQGGIPIEAEGGEFIFSRKAVSALGVDQLNRVNNFYTRKFAAGGPVNPFQDRQAISRSSQTSVASMPMNEKPAWVDELIAAQDRRMDRVKVINVVTETEAGIKTVNKIRADADV